MASSRLLSPLTFIIILVAILITYFTGQLLISVFYSPAGEIDSWYGLPLPWKHQRDIVCGSFNPPPCSSDIYVTYYDWFLFALDVLFYIALAFAVLLLIHRIRHFPDCFCRETRED